MSISFNLDRCKGVIAIAAGAYTTAQTGAVIDRTGYNSAILSLPAGASSGNTLTLTMFEGDGSTAATAVTLSATPAVVTTTAATFTTYQLDLSGMNKNIKFVVTPGNSTSCAYALSVLLFDARVDPGSGTAVTPLRKA